MQPDYNAVVMEHFSLEGWSALYDYQDEKGAEMVVDNHPRLIRLLEWLKSHIRYKDLHSTNILVCRGRAWGEIDFKVIDFDWTGVLGVVRYLVDRNQIP